MKKRVLNILLAFFAISSFYSCNNLLDVKPRTAVDAATALTNEVSLRAALRGAYDRLQGTDLYGSSQIAFAEALSDNGRGRLAGGASTNSGRLSAQLQSIIGAHMVGWSQYYLLINQLNLILEATPKVTDLSPAVRNSIEAQALFLRALAYHDLVKTYAYDPGVEVAANDRGGVPLVLTGVLDAAQVTFPARAPVQEVYDQIYKDLDEATAKLANAETIPAPAFANAAAVNALYSRVALYRRDYTTALAKGNAALLAGAPPIVASTSYTASWRQQVHPESIFELPFTTPENIGVNVSLQSYFTSTVAGQPNTVTGGFGDLVINDAYGSQLFAAFNANPPGFSGLVDQRSTLIAPGAVFRGNSGLRELTKFYGKNGQINLDNIPLIRTPEVILNMAEAQYYLGDEPGANTNLKRILDARYTSGGSAVSLIFNYTGLALLNEILRQRRLELAFEGHRFYDLKRNGENIPRPGGLPVLQYTDIRILAPIPQGDLDANPNLVQNAGY
jgi:hypothetical protein